MNINKYFDETKEKIDNMSAEEFLSVLEEAGIEGCSLKHNSHTIYKFEENKTGGNTNKFYKFEKKLKKESFIFLGSSKTTSMFDRGKINDKKIDYKDFKSGNKVLDKSILGVA
ncbi:hypothetical protein [Halonatronum saccharophilum]|uniref:hypothetical protein n=1 Tax=Halonatronum saccharophilum TaxID=150060 RepID=UPI0004888829|nr:hypothetical protein [Halonatronum saccharophilum]